MPRPPDIDLSTTRDPFVLLRAVTSLTRVLEDHLAQRADWRTTLKDPWQRNLAWDHITEAHLALDRLWALMLVELDPEHWQMPQAHDPRRPGGVRT